MSQDYLLANSVNELDRLRIQAQVWEPEVIGVLNRIGLKPGARCIDLACGPVGILAPLSHIVGAGGHITGLDRDAVLLDAARAHVHENNLTNAEIIEGDAYNTGLPAESFDFVHVRFLFAPVGRDDMLLKEMLRLTHPGGIILIQEPDTTCWNYFPSRPAWDQLKRVILAAFRSGGGDLDAGQRIYPMLRGAGLNNVQIRSAVVALQDKHPYMQLPVQFATSLRKRILDGGLMSESELEHAVSECYQMAADPNTFAVAYMVNQVWDKTLMDEKFDKQKTLDLMRVEFAFVLRTLRVMSPGQMLTPNVQGPWSVKDTIAHLNAWHNRTLTWLRAARQGDGVEGQHPVEPEPGYGWDKIDTFNDLQFERDKELPLEDVLREFEVTFERLYMETEALTEEELFSKTGLALFFRDPMWGYIAYNTFLHYREHIPPLRKWLDEISKRKTTEHGVVNEE